MIITNKICANPRDQRDINHAVTTNPLSEKSFLAEW